MYNKYTAFRCGNLFHIKPNFLFKIKTSFLLLAALLQISTASIGHEKTMDEGMFFENLSDKIVPIQVTGKVTDEKGVPLPGVSIKLKGGSVSAVTNTEGNFAIKLPGNNGVLVFTYVGFATQEVTVGNSKTINVTLKESAVGLNDVVIVGYGQQKKATVTGAITSVNIEELKQPVANLSTGLAGRVAGIIGVQRSGQPGYDNAEIYIRGISTFTNSSPLVLVDGVQRELSNVDPEDIASFSILKDASATAVYGVRGANGVILIQTKKGKVGKPLINFQYDQGVTEFTRLPEFADGATYMQLANEAVHNSKPTDQPRYSAGRIDSTAKGLDPDLYPNTNWFKELFNKTGQNRRARVNAGGGSENARYYLSLGYYDEDGLYKTDKLSAYNSSIKFTRYNFTSNLGLNVTKTTKVDFGASGWLSEGNYPGNSSDAIWGSAYVMPPILIPATYSNGLAPKIATADVFNPYSLLARSGYVSEFRSQLWSNIRVTQDFSFWLKGLSATAMFSFDNYNSHTIERTRTVDGYIAIGRDDNGNLLTKRTSTGSSFLGYNRKNGGTRLFNSEASINYDRTFGKHNVTGMLLYTQSDKSDAFAGDFIASIPYRYMGLAARTTYSYSNKYLLEANFGYNGSETFAPDKRFGFFPALSGGWIISEEGFFKPVANTIEYLKLRYSWGQVGNDRIQRPNQDPIRFGYISTVAGGNGSYWYGAGTSQTEVKGYDIEEYAVSVGWEKATKQNLGLEIKMLHNGISLVVDAFKENRTGIFLRRGDLPNYTGIRRLPNANLGHVINRGIDGTIDLNAKVGKDWNFAFRGNLTWNRAKVMDDANAPWPYPWQQRIGRKYGQRFGYIDLGLFESDEEVANSPEQSGKTAAGDIKYKDLNGDGKISDFDQAPIGYGSIPEIVYGFGPTIRWKGFSVAGWFKGISNVDISLAGDGFQPFSQGGERGNLMAQITDRWTPGNPNPRPFYPRLTDGNENMNYATSTWWMKNGAFMRLQTLQVSYDFNKAKVLKKVGMANLSLYFIGYNLWTISGFKLWDVELGDGRGSQYPLIKTFNFGAKCTFK
ncbi:TonB-linked SusC/RagA family outer membrane protein [Arcticibacter tournemirensis]|uniref:TonB-dependent receptor n=1 Tax=Arcticibacter tournemirensis TaxID=699437 RepID=A0A5M9HGG9_9SPHI|nr:TonB-dependent receptor [Arcticibacter tournemirensis]KAA8484057.1 TonB-dependent receptor [Arcticibacter tournemirensis]TQM51790.1 TonB-linked SusC/RagA family outer membrane protein [Arcticibacter tournemirensis]